ncbi:UDP-N-acetylmuramoyl-L-alanyl-D-glutamate--2,6-diaminopimelate ligase [Patescibacteria group bacterium]|nr:UDP-N-acetylmuramoyl-L-alanyl-D-glutamate--2,6-diaminopimelate ligase [Patescibacteria group bacterium]MBU4338999.1 UDP-N-acetylmuramoyl-L-alanyl-D-glutamate--2,6-diaminopimelate ligase [Patescibacteria group bacterium]MBU4580195.1 UDP-N-acetylmuramoyl-L-alanyl-D-glutamate--2,6-diaminopimelate ligase [Patescibacteria group bacterium]
MFYGLKLFLKKIIPREFILWTHKLRGMAAAYWFGFPARKLRVIGVAGTKGKTTTVNLITRVLERAGHKAAMFSTANMRLAGEESPNTEKLTTPSPFFLQKFLREAVKKNCDYAVIEVSSHALVQYRLWGIDFAKAVITNLMPDHLDYHKDAAEYRDIHLRMIGYKTDAVIVNGDEAESQKLKVKSQKCNSKVKIMNFGLREGDDLRGYDIQLNSNCVGFKAEYKNNYLGDFILNIPGKFNVYNSLAAVSLGVSEGIEPDKIRKALICVRGVPGRLENIKVSDAQDFTVIVDYAHSPDSLKNVYEAIKPYVKNRLIAVLGGTGDRDKTYRSRAGALADQFADIVIATNEDPYSEDPEAIMDQVLSGIKNKKMGKNLFRILDRKEAIAKAVGLAQKGDTILITGKGSEQFMIWGEKKIPWDDREAAREALKEKFKI